jgi:hypothetical protein
MCFVDRSSGATLETFPVSFKIPAECLNYAIRLSGRPKLIFSSSNESHQLLHVHGCRVRIFGSSIEEDLFPVQMARDSTNNKANLGKDGKRKPQREVDRFGKMPATGVSRIGSVSKKRYVSVVSILFSILFLIYPYPKYTLLVHTYQNCSASACSPGS